MARVLIAKFDRPRDCGAMNDLKGKTLRGAVVRVCAQATNLLLRVGSLVILARLLDPRDFGLVGMVTALTGVLSLFRDFGLSAASVQHAEITEDQVCTLFWINVLVGVVLTAITIVCAPFIAKFYHEPRLNAVAIVTASSFLFNSAGIQHAARLQREMRFTTLSVIDTGSWFVGTGIAIGGALAGFGYWALVGMTVALPLTATIAFWIVAGWVPRLPRRRPDVGSLLRFGSKITANGLIVYLASNFEKVLLGRYWGADAIGIYGRAYQLIRIPTDTLNAAVGEVAFSALSRIQYDSARLRSYFLKGYSLVLGLTLPATFGCSIFADDLISILLGPKWRAAAPIFRLLTPTILVFAIANPLSWLLGAMGLVGRGVQMSLVIAPLMIAGYFVGLPYGPKGVASAYSVVMTLWLVPVVIWSLHNTAVSVKDVLVAVSRPLASSFVAATVAVAVCSIYAPSHWARLLIGSTVLMAVYFGMILYVMGQKELYADLLWKLFRRSSEEAALMPVQ